MLPIPDEIVKPFEAIMDKKAIPLSARPDYRKWLMYYLDFRSKYPSPAARSEQVRLFIEKLRSKNQSQKQLKQAAHALSLFFASQPLSRLAPGCRSNRKTETSPIPRSISLVQGAQVGNATSLKGANEQKAGRRGGKRYNEWRCMEKSNSPEWDHLIRDLAAEITTRHYSRRTLKVYADWGRKFQGYVKNKPPAQLSAADVKMYLTYLAVQCKVSASTQNQAFNALLFLYRHILKKDFGEHKDIVRAKRSGYIPIVLSRKEIDSILEHLSHPYRLLVKLLYGCGLRLFEGLKLRVKDFNFDAGLLTVRGKGNKSRTVPIPQSIMPELLAQIEAMKEIHDGDQAAGYAGVFMEDQLAKKYPNAATEFIWQWFFPQESLTTVPRTKERRRFHLHETAVQEALFIAVRKTKLTKRVTSHTFRHSFATHLLQANYDIRTIQTLLGHSDIRTTMIYTHCVPSRTIKEVASPLDF